MWLGIKNNRLLTAPRDATMDAKKLSSFLPLVCSGGYTQSELAAFIRSGSEDFLELSEIPGKSSARHSLGTPPQKQ